MALDLITSVGEWVQERPARWRMSIQLQIDCRCGGGERLSAVCSKRALDPQTVLQKIEPFDRQPAAGDDDPFDTDALPLTDLADHIEQAYHAYPKVELPLLDAPAARERLSI